MSGGSGLTRSTKGGAARVCDQVVYWKSPKRVDDGCNEFLWVYLALISNREQYFLKDHGRGGAVVFFLVGTLSDTEKAWNGIAVPSLTTGEKY